MGLYQILYLAAVASSRMITVDSKDRIMREEDGRHIIFHGVNVVYKVDPFLPD